mgnify:CR=1 FL=1
MRQFFKYMLASMLGTLLIGGVLILILVGALTAAIASSLSFDSGKPAKVKDNSVLHITLDQPVVDRGNEDAFMLDFGPFKNMNPMGLDRILASIDKAKRDDRVKGIFLDLSTMSTGLATAQEIRNKLIEFRTESGKPVVAFADWYTQGTYYLASAADEVYLQPKGDLDFRGLQSEYMFFKGMFEKLDIDVQFIRGSNNQFKSFGEVFTNDRMSEANREQTRVLLNSVWGHYLDAVGSGRKMDREKLNGIAEELRVREAGDAVALGLIDGLKYRDEMLAMVKERFDLDREKDIEWTELSRYDRAFVKGKKDAGGKIAVVFAEGDIMSGESEDGTIGSTTLSAAIRDAREDTTIKAIVLRVNSPGGSGLASDVIWREVKLAKETKPVVVSMGNVAASGGYYISCAAHKIYADPSTITGSIGVFGIIPNMQGFFKNKLGITFDGEKTNRYADMMTTTRPLSEEEKSIIQTYVDQFYDTFKERVAEGRNLSVAQVDSVGQGRVWTGSDAKRIGLVDELGGLEDAIKAASAMAGLTEHRTVNYPEQKPFFEQLMEEMNAQANMWVATEWLGKDMELLRAYQRAERAKDMMGIQARMPYEIRIY